MTRFIIVVNSDNIGQLVVFIFDILTKYYLYKCTVLSFAFTPIKLTCEI